jgi:sedoheptulose-bisphosphatase
MFVTSPLRHPLPCAGVFANVTSPSTKAKLRLLFEVAPLTLLVEKAGGESSCDGMKVSGLDVPITEIDQRTQICFGSKGEVARFEKYLYGESPRFAEVAAAL